MGYKYWNDIKNTEDLGMSANGSISTLENDINGIIGYIRLLTTGGGVASKVNGPLGERFFQKSMASCIDDKSGETVPRYLYVDFIPDGSIPFISSSKSGPRMTSFEGLIPGALTNIARINPIDMVEDLTGGPNPKCKKVCLQVGNSTSKNYKCNYVTLNDIDSISNARFKKSKEGFSKIEPVANDLFKLFNLKNIDAVLFKTYFSLLGVFGIYLLFRILQKMKHKK